MLGIKVPYCSQCDINTLEKCIPSPQKIFVNGFWDPTMYFYSFPLISQEK